MSWFIREVEGVALFNARAFGETRRSDRHLIVLPEPLIVPELPWSPWVPNPAAHRPEWPPCAFDNLPPGIYGLVCYCPRCAIQTGAALPR